MKKETLFAIAAGLGLLFLYRQNAFAGVGFPASGGFIPGTYRSTQSSPSLVPMNMRSTTPQGYQNLASQPTFNQVVRANLATRLVDGIFSRVGGGGGGGVAPSPAPSVGDVPGVYSVPVMADEFGASSEVWAPGVYQTPIDPNEFTMEPNW